MKCAFWGVHSSHDEVLLLEQKRRTHSLKAWNLQPFPETEKQPSVWATGSKRDSLVVSETHFLLFLQRVKFMFQRKALRTPFRQGKFFQSQQTCLVNSHAIILLGSQRVLCRTAFEKVLRSCIIKVINYREDNLSTFFLDGFKSQFYLLLFWNVWTFFVAAGSNSLHNHRWWCRECGKLSKKLHGSMVKFKLDSGPQKAISGKWANVW